MNKVFILSHTFMGYIAKFEWENHLDKLFVFIKMLFKGEGTLLQRLAWQVKLCQSFASYQSTAA